MINKSLTPAQINLGGFTFRASANICTQVSKRIQTSISTAKLENRDPAAAFEQLEVLHAHQDKNLAMHGALTELLAEADYVIASLTGEVTEVPDSPMPSMAVADNVAAMLFAVGTVDPEFELPHLANTLEVLRTAKGYLQSEIGVVADRIEACDQVLRLRTAEVLALGYETAALMRAYELPDSLAQVVDGKGLTDAEAASAAKAWLGEQRRMKEAGAALRRKRAQQTLLGEADEFWARAQPKLEAEL